MEISPILMAKMMFFAFAFGICSGIVFDALRALRMLFSNRPRSGRLYRLCDAKLPFSKRKIYFHQKYRFKYGFVRQYVNLRKNQTPEERQKQDVFLWHSFLSRHRNCFNNKHSFLDNSGYAY